VGIINVLPFVDEAASDAQRTEKFPWALGGYAGFARVPNLGPTHRRFMTENMAYAILRTAPALFYTNVPILCTAVASHLVEALTIAWEIIYYECPANAMVPVTLMGLFSTQTLLTARCPSRLLHRLHLSAPPLARTRQVKFNQGALIKSADHPTALAAMTGMVAGVWLTWAAAAATVAARKPNEPK